MRIAEMLQAIASWLESPNNEALLLAEQNDECMKVVAESCTLAAELLKNAATEVDQLEPVESALNSDSIEEIAALASAFDASGDPGLKKQASVLDELLMSIAAPPNAFAERKDLLENRLVALKHKYENPTKVLSEANGLDAAKKVLEKSDMVKE
jgi:hypothetical protein